LLEDYTDEMIQSAVDLMDSDPTNVAAQTAADDCETRFRREEYAVLSAGLDQVDLRIVHQDLSKYDAEISKFFQRIGLVETLRETRAFCGFTRIFSENGLSLQDKQRQLWKKKPAGDWLPAYVVKGEGIFLELSETEIIDWESKAVRESVAALERRYRQVVQKRHVREISVTPRLVLLHTLSHLLMRQLTFDCGYSTAALRERLYVSDDAAHPMAGILIYTAAGDSEGAMGGLVRMGPTGLLRVSIFECD
jgi:hypothetical protein